MAANQFELAEAYAKLSLKGKEEFQRGLGGIHRSLKSIQTQMEATARYARMMFLAMTGGMTLFIKLASDAEEIQSKFNTVFKEGAEGARKWSEEFARSVGRNRINVQQYMATFQDTFVPLGFARKQSAELSKQLTKLAVDLASFNNTNEPETIQLLTSALVGNHEAVRRFGVVITQATLNQELLNMGIAGGIKAATEQQKVMARMNIILKSTSDAQGDAVRTAGGLANQWRAMVSQAKGLAIALGQSLTPTALVLIGHFKQLATRLAKVAEVNANSIANWFLFGTAMLGIVAIAPKLIGALAGIISLVKVLVGSGVMGGVIGVFITALGLLAAAFIAAKLKGESFGDFLNDLKDDLLGVEGAVTKLRKTLAEEKERGERTAIIEEAAKKGDTAAIEEQIKWMKARWGEIEETIGGPTRQPGILEHMTSQGLSKRIRELLLRSTERGLSRKIRDFLSDATSEDISAPLFHAKMVENPEDVARRMELQRLTNQIQYAERLLAQTRARNIAQFRHGASELIPALREGPLEAIVKQAHHIGDVLADAFRDGLRQGALEAVEAARKMDEERMRDEARFGMEMWSEMHRKPVPRIAKIAALQQPQFAAIGFSSLQAHMQQIISRGENEAKQQRARMLEQDAERNRLLLRGLEKDNVGLFGP